MCLFTDICFNWWQALMVLLVSIYLLTGIIATAIIVVAAGPRFDKVEEPLTLHLWSCLLLVFLLPIAMFCSVILDKPVQGEIPTPNRGQT